LAVKVFININYFYKIVICFLTSTMSAADAATALLQNLASKVERVNTSCAEQQASIDKRLDELRRLRIQLRTAETTEARIKEYEGMSFAPSWESICSISSSSSSSAVTLRVLEEEEVVGVDEQETRRTNVSSSSPAYPQLVIGLPAPPPPPSSSSSTSTSSSFSLHGKVFDVATLAGARCIAGYLRGSGFIAPLEAGALADVLHTANDMRLDELAMLVRDHILAAATGGGEGNTEEQ
jgi:hypothetical protein